MWTRMTAGAGRKDGSYHVAPIVTPSSVRNETRCERAWSIRGMSASSAAVKASRTPVGRARNTILPAEERHHVAHGAVHAHQGRA